MSDLPVIYLVDDEDQTANAEELMALGVHAEYLYPTQVDDDHLLDATLLAVDEVFDLTAPTRNEDWDVPADLPPALLPRDGLALAAVLRSASVELGRTTPLGITMRTSRLVELGHGVPEAVRKPFVASQYDLEWATDKPENDTSSRPLAELVGLARALHSYPTPTDWKSDPQGTGVAWLGLPEQPWADLARNHIVSCRPPANTTSTNRHNLAWFRWLAQTALPFPTFLVSDVYAATTLGVTLDSFRSALANPDAPLAVDLAAVIYAGPLAQLQPARYWRAGLRHLASTVVDDELDITDPHEVGARLAAKYNELEPLEMMDPVVTVDVNYWPQATPVDRSDAVRLAPDGWPVYADPAWASAEEATDADVAALRAPLLR